MMIALRTDHDVDGRCAADDLFALGLCDAAGDDDVHLAAVARGFILGDTQAPEFGVDLLGGFFADVAGIEDDEVRIIRAVGLDKAFARQRVHHALRIVDVHLAAIRLDMQLARRLHGTRVLDGNRAIGGAGLRYSLKERKSSTLSLSFRDGAQAPDPESRDSGFDADGSPRNDA